MKVSARNGGIAGIVAGFGYLVQAIMGLMMGLIKPQSEVFSGASDDILEVIFVITLIATIFGLMGLHSFAQNRYGRAGTIGFWLAILGASLMTISTIAAVFAGENSPGFAFFGSAFLGGMLFTLIGYIILGMMALRRKVLPVWGGLALLLLGFPLSVFLRGPIDKILFGLAWLGVGYLLSKQES